MCVVSLHHDITTGSDVLPVEQCVFAFLACCCVVAAPWLASARCSSSHNDCVYQLMLSQHPAGCAVAVRYLPSLLTNLIFLCTMFTLNSAPDQTACRFVSISVRPRPDIFSTNLPLRKIPWLCLYIHASHSQLIGILREICCIRLLWPQTFGPHESLLMKKCL